MKMTTSVSVAAAAGFILLLLATTTHLAHGRVLRRQKGRAPVGDELEATDQEERETWYICIF
jgi:hypothetical protein